jgi:toxin ParE1/3/4
MGVRRRDIRVAMRMLVETPFVILYEISPDLYEISPDSDEGPVDTVEIVRIVNSRQDLPNLF